MSLQNLIADYKNSCDAIVKQFCNKQGMDFEYWIDETTCDIAAIGDCCFNLSDIIIDLKELAPKGKILEWYWDSAERNHEQKMRTNYISYIKNNYKFFD